jgi:hypothetical protein
MAVGGAAFSIFLRDMYCKRDICHISMCIHCGNGERELTPFASRCFPGLVIHGHTMRCCTSSEFLENPCGLNPIHIRSFGSDCSPRYLQQVDSLQSNSYW